MLDALFWVKIIVEQRNMKLRYLISFHVNSKLLAHF